MKLPFSILAASCLLVGLSSCNDEKNEDPPLSKEAQITSFTFDTSKEGNEIVTSQPVANGNTFTFTVNGMADGLDMGLLSPTIVVSDGATYSFSGSFPSGMTYTVTAEDQTTTNTYTAICTGSMFDVYSGLLDVSMLGTELAKDLPYNISLEKESATSVSVYIADFTIKILGMDIPLGDVEIGGCEVTKVDNHYTFNGSLDLGTINVPVGEAQLPADCVVNVVDASVIDGTFTLPLKIDVLVNGTTPLPVEANFVGTPMEEEA